MLTIAASGSLKTQSPPNFVTYSNFHVVVGAMLGMPYSGVLFGYLVFLLPNYAALLYIVLPAELYLHTLAYMVVSNSALMLVVSMAMEARNDAREHGGFGPPADTVQPIIPALARLRPLDDWVRGLAKNRAMTARLVVLVAGPPLVWWMANAIYVHFRLGDEAPGAAQPPSRLILGCLYAFLLGGVELAAVLGSHSDSMHALLCDLLPEHVARALVERHEQQQEQALSSGMRPRRRRMSTTTATSAGKALCYGGYHDSVTLLFADIKGFTSMSSQVEPQAVMEMLNELYAYFDTLTTRMPVYKVETVGDCYVAATGLLHDDPHHALTMLQFAHAMLRHARTVPTPNGTGHVMLRVGIHSGPVTTGVVGTVRKRFCLFGDTMNTASRMESNGEPMRIHISAHTHALALADLAAPASGPTAPAAPLRSRKDSTGVNGPAGPVSIAAVAGQAAAGAGTNWVPRGAAGSKRSSIDAGGMMSRAVSLAQSEPTSPRSSSQFGGYRHNRTREGSEELGGWRFTARGSIDVKGKGSMETFWVEFVDDGLW